MLRITLAILSLLLVAGLSYSDTIYVDDDNVSGPWDGSIQHPYQYVQDGIDAALNGDIVRVLSGTYIGIGNKNLDLRGKAIILTSQDGPESTIIDCENDGRGFYLHTGEGADSVISGFTITGGCVDLGGGGIYCHKSSPTISGNIISGNKDYPEEPMDYGGGIYCYKSSAIIIDNDIEDNFAHYGGGIYCHESSPVICDNNILDNSCFISGGGIYCDKCVPNIEGNMISGNNIACVWGDELGFGGAGIYCRDSSCIMISDNVISNNSTAGISSHGGGIHCWNCSYTTIEGNTITDNNGGYSGGGIHCNLCLNTNIIDNTISNNRVYYPYMDWKTHEKGSFQIKGNRDDIDISGGGIYCSGSTIIAGNTITDNSLTSYIGMNTSGGGIFCEGTTTIANNTISNNDAYDGGGIKCSGATRISGNTITGNFTIYGNSNHGGGISCSGTTDIDGNAITYNRSLSEGSWGGGIYCDGDVNLCDPGRNSIYGNTAGSCGPDVYVGAPTHAENNWWNQDPPDPIRFCGYIDYDPWLLSPPGAMNAPPLVYGLYITPTHPLVSDNLVASYSYFDADGDPENITEIRWYRDGLLQGIYNDMLTIPSSVTSPGEEWYFTARSSDGEDFGEVQTSHMVSINTAPAAINVAISPAMPLTGDDLLGIYIYQDSDSDPEGDTEVRWYMNGCLQSDYFGDLTVPSSATAKDQQWSLSIRPHDGTNFGEIQISPLVIICNTAPDVEAGPDQSVNRKDIVSFNGSLIDPDTNDTHTIEWDFGDGGLMAGTLTPTYSYNNTGTYIVTLKVTDNDSGVGIDSLTVTVEGSCPFSLISRDEDALKNLRHFRDDMLVKSETGQEFINLYYQHGFEISEVLISDPALSVCAASILRDMMPGVLFLMGDKKGRDIVITSHLVARINRLFSDIGEEGSGELSEALSMLREMLEKHKGKRISRIWNSLSTE
jgi:nitrous oxidase accessory protein NosD